MLELFGTALRRSKSLNSLHLSGNLGDSKEIRDAICERAHVKVYDPTFRPDFKLMFGNVRKGPIKLENTVLVSDAAAGIGEGPEEMSE